MKLTGELKKKVEAAESRDEAKKAIEMAGMLLSDDELDAVNGGVGAETDLSMWKGYKISNDLYHCPLCNQENEFIDHLSDEVIAGRHIEVIVCQNCFGSYAYIQG